MIRGEATSVQNEEEETAHMNVLIGIGPKNLPLGIKHRWATIMPRGEGGGIAWGGGSLPHIIKKRMK